MGQVVKMQMVLDLKPDRISAPEEFLAGVIQFNRFGQDTKVVEQHGIPYFINEFWTSGQRKSHSLHEISYRACFKAQLPEFFIERLTKPKDIVLDPFMGRGTTVLQAALMGRNSVGNDINPISTFLSRPRLTPIRIEDVAAGLKTIDWSRGSIQRDDLLAFYHPETLKKLESLRLWISEKVDTADGAIDPIVDWIRMVSLNRLSGHSPGFFSGRSMPPNQAVSVNAQLKINEKLGVSPPDRDVEKIILKKTASLLKDGVVNDSIVANFYTGSAWDISGISANTVDLVVTSPPFLDIVQYASDNWLRCWFAGIDADNIAIDSHKTEAAWSAMVEKVLTEMLRVLKPGGHIAFEVGEVRNGKVLLEKLVWSVAAGLKLDRLGVLINDQEFTKTANCWGVANNSVGTNTNRIVVLRKK